MPRTPASAAPRVAPVEFNTLPPYVGERSRVVQLRHIQTAPYPGDPPIPDMVQFATGTSPMSMLRLNFLPEDMLRIAREMHNFATHVIVNIQAHAERQRN